MDSFWEWLRLVFSAPYAIAGGVCFILSILLAWLLSKKSGWEDRMKKWQWKGPLIVLGICILIGLTVSSYNLYRDQEDELASLQDELEQERTQHRPEMTLGQYLGASAIVDEEAQVVDITVHLMFRNIGDRPAYQLRMRVGGAYSNKPELFHAMPDLENPNRLDAGGEIGPDLPLRVPFVEQEGVMLVPDEMTLVYVGLRYSNKPEGGNYYEEEFWLLYVLGEQRLAMATMEQKKALEPYVRVAYSERDN